jgi:hypothetical protein
MKVCNTLNPVLPKRNANYYTGGIFQPRQLRREVIKARKQSTPRSLCLAVRQRTVRQRTGSNKSISNITKKRKNNKASSADEDVRRKQKAKQHPKNESSYSLGVVGNGKMAILPPSPFVSKSISSSSVREM